MSTHPTHEKLAEFAWDALEGAEADAVEAHVASCAECALYAERVRSEARRISGALEVTVPAGLSARILAAAGSGAAPSGAAGFRFGPWLGVAAAALFAVTAAWAWQDRQKSLARIGDLERKIAEAPKPAPQPAPALPSVDEILAHQTKAEVQLVVDEIVDGTTVTQDGASRIRLALSGATDTTTEMVLAAARGNVDWNQILSTDTMAGLTGDLRSHLEPEDYNVISAAILSASRADAASSSHEMALALQSAAGLDTTQTATIESYLIDKTASRIDFHFLPGVAQREIVARLIGAGGKLKSQPEALLNSEQRGRVIAYLASAETGRNRYWDNYRKKS